MCEGESIKKEFDDFYTHAEDMPDALPEEIAREYEVLSRAGSEDSLLFKLRRRCDSKLFALRCAPLSTGRAKREYEILSALKISGVPAAVNYCESGSCGWLVREYAEGEDLSRLVGRGGALDANQTSAIICEVCDILSALHTQLPPVVHRDIKPQNVIVSPGGSVTLIDFDAARRYDSAARSDTEYLGTRAFAPPEQFGYAQTDSRSDIYSLGVLLLYLFTGSSELERACELPEPLRSVFSRCTAFSPRERFADALSVKAALTGKASKSKLKPLIALAAALLALGVFAFARANAAKPSPGDAALEAALAAASGEGVYMIGTESYATREEYYAARSASPETYSRGEVSGLGSLARSAGNLRELMLVNQPLDSLADISALVSLENLSVDYCGITSLEGVEALPNLRSLSLTDTGVDDVSPLKKCPALDNLCIRGILCKDFSALESFERFNFLDIAAIPRALTLPCLEGCSVSILKADYTGLASLGELEGITGVETLEINNNSITSLEGIERYAALNTLNIARNPIEDFSPLTKLKYLTRVVCSQDQLAALEAAGGDFEITAV